MAGVAAVALIAGTGFASAQTMDQRGGTQAGQSASPSASRGGMNGMHQKGSSHAQAQEKAKSGETAQNTNQNGKAGLRTQNNTNLGVAGKNGAKTGRDSTQRNAQNNERSNSSVAQQWMDHNNPQKMEHNNQSSQNANRNDRTKNQNARNKNQNNRTNSQNAQNVDRNNKTNKRGMAANNRTEQNRQTTAQQSNVSGQMRSKNGSVRVHTASGTSVRLSTEQRTRIQRTVINARNAPRVSHVQFSVNVGTVIPRHEFTSIRVVPVPQYLVRIEPRWRGLEYFVFHDEVVIVSPRDLRIVAIVPV
ncbi:MAG: DUF1236 domain-containing protein [Xanthobacteraceae bacterium]